MRASWPNIRGPTTLVTLPTPSAPFGSTSTSLTKTLSATLYFTTSPAFAVLLLRSSANSSLITESFGKVTVSTTTMPSWKARFASASRRPAREPAPTSPFSMVSSASMRLLAGPPAVLSVNCHSTAFSLVKKLASPLPA